MKEPQLSIRTTLLLIISILNVLIAILIGSNLYESWVKLREAQSLTRESVTINLFYRAQKYLSLERGAALSVIYASPDTAQSLQEDIATDRKEAAAALQQGIARVKAGTQDTEAISLLERVEAGAVALQNLRLQLDAAMAKPAKARDFKLPDRIFDASTDLIMRMRDLMIYHIRPLQTLDAVVARQMMFKYAVWEMTEYAGREYAEIGRLIAEEKPVTHQIQANLLTWKALVGNEWDMARQLAEGSGLDSHLAPYINEAQAHYFLTFGQVKNIFYAPLPASSPTKAAYPLSTEMWLVFSSEAVDSLLALKDASLRETQAYVDQMEHHAEQAIFVTAFLFLCALAISLYCMLIIIRRVIRPVNTMVDALYKTSQGLPHEPLPSLQTHDEIGKLASVLEVFEDNLRVIKQSNEELERYAYITAHDLKSPLRAIDNLSQWIEEDLGFALEGKIKEHMDLLRKRVRRMEKLLNDTLEYSRIGKQLDAGESEIINGKSLVEDAVSMSAPPPGFTIKISDAFSTMKLARMPLQQVFYNLINNAIKHHDKNTGVITIGAKEEPAHYVFSVADDGPGIPSQYHEKIFEMFQTLKPRDQREGSGMGLAIIRKILTTCGGSITVESEPGQGALFCFVWPKSSHREKE